MVTGQSENTQSCWPDKFKPNLIYHSSKWMLLLRYSLLARLHLRVSYLSIFCLLFLSVFSTFSVLGLDVEATSLLKGQFLFY